MPVTPVVIPVSDSISAPGGYGRSGTAWYDTEAFLPDTTLLLHPAGEARQVWGEGSTIATGRRTELPGSSAEREGDPWQTSLIVVVLICFYCYILYRFRRELVLCLKNIGKTGGILLLREEQGGTMTYFLRSGVVLALLAASALAMDGLETRLTHVANYYLFAGGIVAFAGVVLFRRLILALACGLSEDKEAFRDIGFINRMDFTMMAVVYLLVAIVVSQSNRWFVPGVIFLGLLVLYHFWTLYKYFILRGFSIFQLILYLCTVEILPVSFIIALAVRNSGIN